MVFLRNQLSLLHPVIQFATATLRTLLALDRPEATHPDAGMRQRVRRKACRKERFLSDSFNAGVKRGGPQFL
jgi:hypothetical protein